MQNEKIFISLISDTTFKYLFKNESTRDFLTSIIKEKFNVDLNEYVLINNEDNTGSKVKDYRMDLVFYKEETNEYVILEATSSKEFLQSKTNQTHQYLFRKASSGFDKGDNYNNPPKVRLIEFNNYIRTDIPAHCTEATYMLYSEEANLTYDDVIIHEIYLPKYHQMCYNKLSDVNKKLWMFSATSFDEYKDIHDENEKIVKELERLSMNNKFIDEYDYENVQKKLVNSARNEGYDNGFNNGFDNGFDNGVKQRNSEIAKNMLLNNIDLNVISKITGLSEKEINELKQD